MEITGQQHIAAPRARVWDALNDPAVLKACLPGCESVERVTPEEFKVVIRLAIGPLRARFQGKLKMVEARAPESCVMQFEGQGGTVGFGKGTSEVTLSERDGGTELAYKAKAQVGGNLAQIGSRLIDSFAKKMTDDFFQAFRAQLVPAPAAAAAPATTALTPAAPAAPAAPVTGAPVAAAPAATAQGPAAAVPQVPAWWLAPAAALGAFLAILGAQWIGR